MKTPMKSFAVAVFAVSIAALATAGCNDEAVVVPIPSAGHAGSGTVVAGGGGAGGNTSIGVAGAGGAILHGGNLPGGGAAAGGAGGGSTKGGAGGQIQGGAAGAGSLRTVITRSPYGALDTTKNVLLDGDFELQTTSISPMWTQTDANGQPVDIGLLSGARCHAGIYCVAVAENQQLYNDSIVVPPGGMVHASAWIAANGAGDCSKTSVAIAVFDQQGNSTTYDQLVKTTGDSSAYCHFEVDATIPAIPDGSMATLFIVPTTAIIVDTASVTLVGAVPFSHTTSRPTSMMDPELRARAERGAKTMMEKERNRPRMVLRKPRPKLIRR